MASRRDSYLRGRYVYLFFSLCVILFISMTLAVMLGPVPIRPGTVWQVALFNLPMAGEWLEPWLRPHWTQAEFNIVWMIRFPRVLLAAVVGAGLAVVGAVMQVLVRNSLADPYILGVSSGASVGATMVLLFGAFRHFGHFALSMGAFVGALGAMVLVFFVSQVGGGVSPARLLLAGVSVSMMLTAMTNMILISSPDDEGLRSALFWIMGGFSGAKWSYATLPTLVVLVSTSMLTWCSRPLNVLLLGSEAAKTLGIDVDSFRKLLLVVTAMITGVLVSASGAIGFVGLMVPHVVRFLVGSNHRYVLPLAALVGSIFLVWADVLARMLWAPEELPVGVISALCGAPFFIWLLRHRSYSFGDRR